MEHEHPAPAPTQAPSRIIVIDDEQVLRHGLGNDIDVADIPGVIRSAMRRTAVSAIKHSSVLDSIRTRFETARMQGATVVGKPKPKAEPRHNLAEDLVTLRRDLASIDVPEVQFETERDNILQECTNRYAASTHSWKTEGIQVSRPKESLASLYESAIRSLPKKIVAVLFLFLGLATGALSQGPMGAGAGSHHRLRRPHLHIHLRHNNKRLPMRGHFHRQR